MVKIQIRIRKLQALLDIRLGPGAAVLPRDVKRIHLDFAIKMNDGHMGARKFWHECLPRLKYHNPAVSMTVNRTNDQEGPATLTIFFAPPSPPSHTPATSPPTPSSTTTTDKVSSEHAPFDRTESIDMKHIRDSEILSRLMSLTKATQVFATPDEEASMLKLKEDFEVNTQNALADIERREKVKKENALLKQAKAATMAM